MTCKWTVCSLLSVLIVLYVCSAEAKDKEENTATTCQDGEDNDGDTFVDCDDQDCSYMIFCAEKEEEKAEPEPTPPVISEENLENTIEKCRDFKDNDSDGHIDCDDQDCALFVFCLGQGTGTGPRAGIGLKKEPHPSKGGIGIYPSIVVFGRGKVIGDVKNTSDDYRQEHKMQVNAGVGIFGEFLVAPHFAIGGEINLTFPKIDEVRMYSSTTREWSDWSDCDPCEANVLFNLMLRMKFPVKMGRWAAVYPLVTMGLSNFAFRQEDADARNFFGLGYSAGLGLEVYTPTVVTPCFDIRYLGGATWRVDMESAEERIYDYQLSLFHSIALNFGIRFL